MNEPESAPRILTQRDDHVLNITLNRPDKRNAFDVPMVRALSAALTELDGNDALRVGLVTGAGPMFCAGLDLMSVAPVLASGDRSALLPEDAIDPWGVAGPRVSKPVVVAVHGRCYTAGLELGLACDIIVAAEGTRFAQQEVSRGIFPLGGGTWRWVDAVGWGNAMRYMLTGDELDATEAYRIGLVQEVVPPEELVGRARALAARIAAQAPLGVRATLRSARTAREHGPRRAGDEVLETIVGLAATEDVQEGIAAMMERRDPAFRGR